MYEKTLETIQPPRRANQCISDALRAKPAAPLFDEFWREGELGLLFGAHSTGKSVLAVQIADALARGTPLSGFRMSTSRHQVLYVDLDASDAQFGVRYPKVKFPERLFRERPPYNADLCEWISTMVSENGFRVVIIDSLSAIKRTHDGIRETLVAMRRLKQMCAELGISILAITDSFDPTDGPRVTEDELKRSRVLCTVADSVFAIGRKRWPEGGRYISQIRSRRGTIVWDFQNAPVATIKQLASGLLGFEFDERFSPQLDEKRYTLLWNINSMHKEGASFRDIAEMLGISKTTAHTLWKKWSPLIENLRKDEEEFEPRIDTNEHESYETDDCDGEYDDDSDDLQSSHPYESGVPAGASPRGVDVGGVAGVSPDGVVLSDRDPTTVPFAAGLARRSIYDLRCGYDSYGREIFVESQNERTGQPDVWYQFDRHGIKRRFERGPFGIQVEHLNAGPFL